MIKTIENNAESILIEKKSKFIANVFYVENIEDAEGIIKSVRKKYHDSRHVVFAYRILEENQVIERQSDDGEPSGTAGAPILNILSKQNLTNVLVTVTRYFGGILLGTGGLVKAYSESSKDAVEKAGKIELEKGYTLEMSLDYEKQKDFEYMCEKNKINIISKEYSDKVKNIIEISEQKFDNILQNNLKNDFQNFPFKILKNKFIKS